MHQNRVFTVRIGALICKQLVAIIGLLTSWEILAHTMLGNRDCCSSVWLSIVPISSLCRCRKCRKRFSSTLSKSPKNGRTVRLACGNTECLNIESSWTWMLGANHRKGKGNEKYKGKDYRGAIDDYTNAIEAHPDPAFYTNRAAAHMMILQFNKVCFLFFTNALVQLAYSSSTFRLWKTVTPPSHSIPAIRRRIPGNPKLSRAWYAVSCVYMIVITEAIP